MSSESLHERYRRVHRIGQDCRITCSRNLLELYGHRHSYSTIQGLSSSFFFTYRRTFGPREQLLFPSGAFCDIFWPVAGQRFEALENLTYLFNATLVTHEGESNASAEASIRGYLREGMPVMVAISREVIQRHLGFDYVFPSFLSGLNFGGHWVVLTGIDDQRGTAWVFETDNLVPMEVPLEVLAAARTHGDNDPSFYLKSRNRWAVLVPPSQRPPLGHMIQAALTKVVANMTEAAATSEQMGLPALAKLRQELPGWWERDDLPLEKLKATVFMLRLSSDMIAGGSLGRRSFGIYLRQAERVLGEPRLGTAAACYGDAAELWGRLMDTLEARLFQGQGPSTFATPDVRELLDQLFDLEQRGFAQLESCFGGQR